MHSLEPHPPAVEAEVAFPIIRRLYALVAFGLGMCPWMFFSWMEKVTGGLAALVLWSALLALVVVRRFYARYRLSETALTGRDLGWTGPRSIDLAYSRIRGLGPQVAVTGESVHPPSAGAGAPPLR